MKKIFLVCSMALLSGAISGCGGNSSSSSSSGGAGFEVFSPSFEENGALPGDYSCEGKAFGEGGFSPELHWTDGPQDSKSYAVVFKDLTVLAGPQAELGYHWVIWNIPESIHLLPRNLSTTRYPEEMEGAEQKNGINNGFEYFGPCPSYNFCSTGTRNTDTYAFTVYALAEDTTSQSGSVQEIDSHLNSIALAKTEILVTSDAAPRCDTDSSSSP